MQRELAFQARRRAAMAVTAAIAVAGFASCASSASASTSTAKAASGTPIEVMNDTTVGSPIASFPEAVASAQAAADAINTAGGVNGHPIKIINCNNGLTPNGAESCAREAVKDKVAIYTGVDGYAPEIFSTLQKAHIAASVIPITIPSVQSTDNFPIGGHGVAENVGMPYAVKESGAKTSAVVAQNFPGFPQDGADDAKNVAKYGIKNLTTVSVTTTQTTFSSTIAQLQAKNPQAVMLISSAAQIEQIIQAGAAVGFTPIWITSAGSFNPTELQAASKISPKFWLDSALPPATATKQFPAIARFAKEEATAGKHGVANTSPSEASEAAVYEWLTIHAFATLASKIHGSVTSASVLAKMKSTKNLSVEGLISWSPGAKGLKSYPDIKDGGKLYVGPVKNGVYTPKSTTAQPVLQQLGF